MKLFAFMSSTAAHTPVNSLSQTLTGYETDMTSVSGSASAPAPVVPSGSVSDAAQALARSSNAYAVASANVSAAAAPFPISLFGNLNPSPVRTFNVSFSSGLSALADTEENKKYSVTSASFNLTGTSVFVSQLNCWSTVTVTSYTVTFSPKPQTYGKFIELHTVWIPANESIPTDSTAMMTFPTYQYQTVFSPVPGGYCPAVIVTCPLGQDDCNGTVRPVKAANFPSLYTLVKVMDNSGKVVRDGSLLYGAKAKFQARVGL